MPIGSLLPLLFVPLVIAYMFYMRRFQAQSMKKSEEDNARFRVGEVARRLGLQVVEGEPTINLVMASANRQQDLTNAAQPMFGGVMRPEIRVHLTGALHGRPAELVYYDRIDIEDSVLSGRTVTHRLMARIAVVPRAQYPDFELYLRAPGMMMEAQPQLALPEMTLGDPALDRQFVFKCGDPRVGPALAAALGPLMAMAYVHVQGGRGAVTFVMTRWGLSVGMYHDEAVFHVLSSIAAVLEGVPMPDAAALLPAGAGGAGAEQEQLPVPCKRCGAPMRELPGTHLHGAVTVACDYCRAQESLPADAAQRVTALRSRLSQLRWAQDALKGPELTIARMIETFKSPFVLAMYGVVLLMLVAGQYSGIQSALDSAARLPPAERLAMYRTAIMSPMFMIGALLGTALGYVFVIVRYRRKVRPLMLARAPSGAGSPVRCRCCGGNLPAATTPFRACRYCNAQNLVTPEVAHESAAQLDRDVRDYQARAAGAVGAFASHGFTSWVFYAAFFGGIGLMVGLGALFSAVILPLLVG